MSAIKLENFGGMMPIVDKRLLPNGLAQRSENTWLYSGSLQGFTEPAPVASASGAKVFRIPNDQTSTDLHSASTWLQFSDIDTDVVRAPMINDQFQRYYWASPSAGPMFNTLARIQSGQPAYRLGLEPPRLAPAVTATKTFTISIAHQNYSKDQTPPESSFVQNSDGTSTTTIVSPNPIDGTSVATVTTSTPNQTEVRAYLYTWVSEFGEETAPSPPALANGDIGSLWTIVVHSPSQGSDRSPITKTRIYRTVTSAAGVATYFFVAEIPVSLLSFVDTVANDLAAGQGELQSANWTPPPADLRGLAAMPNGMLLGWTGHDIWFCEPYRPHAWPADYSVSVEHPVVGIGVFNSTAVLATTGTPFTASGVHPANVSLAKINVHEPCVSRGSIVSSFDSVFYTSQNGIIQAMPGQAVNITSQLIAPKQWQALFQPAKLRAVRYQRAYLAMPTAGATTLMGVIIDPTNQRVLFNLIPVSSPLTNLQEDLWTGEVLLISGGTVSQFNAPGTPMQRWYWRSKEFQYLKPLNMEGMRIWFRVPDGAPTLTDRVTDAAALSTLEDSQYGIVRLFADGRLVYSRELRSSGEMFRLPAGFKAETWEVEVEGRVEVLNVQMASDLKELASV